MDSTMLLMDVISAACAAYCAYTWVRLLRERKLFKNELLLGFGALGPRDERHQVRQRDQYQNPDNDQNNE